MHLYRCADQELRHIVQTGLGELEDVLHQRHAPAEMWQAICDGILSYCTGEPYNTQALAGPVRMAVLAQTRIGWDNFLKGRLATNWGDMMAHRYATSANLRRLESRQRFVTKVIHSLWDLYDTLWGTRCGRLHDDADVDSLGHAAVDAKVQFYFANKRNLFDSGDLDRFHMGLEHTLALNIHRKRAWLQTLANRIIATDRARKRLHSIIRPITSYFPPIRTNNDDLT